jgi:predicted phage terminase large subunit-like protein
VTFSFTKRQQDAQQLLSGPATHILLYGGSRSGKTFFTIRTLVMRALKAPGSRHAILRFRFNHLKASIVYDTFPKVMQIAFPGITYRLDKTDWYVEFPNGATLWFGGLDDKERTEKILGQEYATIFLNECSQIPLGSRGIAITRLAQRATQVMAGAPPAPLRPRMIYDCNPPSKAHWCYRLFIAKEDPDTGRPLDNPDDYAALGMNPADNADNLAAGYLETLQSLSPRLRKRFLDGEFAEANPNALFSEQTIERWRVMHGELPNWQRIVIGVDPSGSGDVDNADNDEIGIVVVALGQDGIGYVLEDCTLKTGPSGWGAVVASAFERHDADAVVAEGNFGGAMVEYVLKTSSTRRRMPVRMVTASRGKVVRAEPVSALFDEGKVRIVGEMRQLEQELIGFSTAGYIGEGSPNRADALVWACTELFPGLVRPDAKQRIRPAYSLT